MASEIEDPLSSLPQLDSNDESSTVRDMDAPLSPESTQNQARESLSKSLVSASLVNPIPSSLLEVNSESPNGNYLAGTGVQVMLGSLTQDGRCAPGEEVTAPSIIIAPPSVVNSRPTDPNVLQHSSQLQGELSHEANVIPILLSDKAPQVTAEFVPSLGSWAKPLFFKAPATPPAPCTPRDYDPAVVGNQLAALWPSLNDEILNKQPKNKHPTRSLQLPIDKLPPPELKADGSLRFPWAARLSAQSRNLYRAASPTYRLDGTPEVSIPSKVLRLGPENKDEYIIGKFHKCSPPPGGLVHAVVNRIWGRSCKISCKKLGDSSFMFHIPHQPTRQWVIQRGVWHIDDCLLFVLPWIPEGSFKIPEISTLPVWVNLKNIPDCCYSRLGISHVASGLGEPILTHKPRLDPTSMGEAKVLVEMELDRDFPKLIALDDKQGSIYLVNVDYTWIPSMCERCGNLGHKAKRCLLSQPPHDSTLQSHTEDVGPVIPVVDIDLILQQSDITTSSPPTIHQKDINANENLLPTTSDSGASVIQNLIKEMEGFQAPGITHSSQPGLEDTPQLHPLSDTTMECHGKEEPRFTLLSSSPCLQQEDQALSTLVDSQSTPTTTPIMEFSPSSIINNEVQKIIVVDPLTATPQTSAFESPSHVTVLSVVDEAEREPSSSLSLSKGGRETKPPIKYQDMEWKTVRGKGKHGRRGRGSYH
ncbi:hypothetical protein N665_0001s0155 [Sinapis alba]|nr:hypothetical protein N665_0001s0155 [Sinapis alba]